MEADLMLAHQAENPWAVGPLLFPTSPFLLQHSQSTLPGSAAWPPHPGSLTCAPEQCPNSHMEAGVRKAVGPPHFRLRPRQPGGRHFIVVVSPLLS